MPREAVGLCLPQRSWTKDRVLSTWGLGLFSAWTGVGRKTAATQLQPPGTSWDPRAPGGLTLWGWSCWGKWLPWFLGVRTGDCSPFLVILPKCRIKCLPEKLRKGCFWNIRQQDWHLMCLLKNKPCWHWPRLEDSMTSLNQCFAEAGTDSSSGSKLRNYGGRSCLSRMRKIWLNGRTSGELAQSSPWRRGSASQPPFQWSF